MLAPAKIPVAAGKKIAKTEKKLSPPLKSGLRLSSNTSTVKLNINILQCLPNLTVSS